MNAHTPNTTNPAASSTNAHCARPFNDQNHAITDTPLTAQPRTPCTSRGPTKNTTRAPPPRAADTASAPCRRSSRTQARQNLARAAGQRETYSPHATPRPSETKSLRTEFCCDREGHGISSPAASAPIPGAGVAASRPANCRAARRSRPALTRSPSASATIPAAMSRPGQAEDRQQWQPGEESRRMGFGMCQSCLMPARVSSLRRYYDGDLSKTREDRAGRAKRWGPLSQPKTGTKRAMAAQKRAPRGVATRRLFAA